MLLINMQSLNCIHWFKVNLESLPPTGYAVCDGNMFLVTQSQSATVYFFCTISYTVAVCDCVFLLYDFLHSRSLRLCISSVRFLSSSSSVNTSKSYISDMTWPILTRLGHKYRLTIPFMSHDQIRVKGHVGVTGVKKVIFTKNATSTDYRVRSCDSCTCISLTPSTKVMGLKIHPGSFGVTGVKKRSFSLKTLLLLQITGYGHVTHVHTSAWPPLQKLWV